MFLYSKVYTLVLTVWGDSPVPPCLFQPDSVGLRQSGPSQDPATPTTGGGMGPPTLTEAQDSAEAQEFYQGTRTEPEGRGTPFLRSLGVRRK